MHIEIWESDQWYWHFRSKGRVVADSEGFPTKSNAMRAAKACVKAVAKAKPRFVLEQCENLYKLTWSFDNEEGS